MGLATKNLSIWAPGRTCYWSFSHYYPIHPPQMDTDTSTSSLYGDTESITLVLLAMHHHPPWRGRKIVKSRSDLCRLLALNWFRKLREKKFQPLQQVNQIACICAISEPCVGYCPVRWASPPYRVASFVPGVYYAHNLLLDVQNCELHPKHLIIQIVVLVFEGLL